MTKACLFNKSITCTKETSNVCQSIFNSLVIEHNIEYGGTMENSKKVEKTNWKMLAEFCYWRKK